MRMSRVRRRLTALVLVGAGVLAGCGDGETSVGVSTREPPPPSTVGTTLASTTTVPPGSAPTTTTTAGPASGPPPSRSPSSPASTMVTAVPGVDSTPNEPVPTRVEPLPRAVDVRPRPFDRAVALDERTVSVRFWGGVAPCDVVGRVDVTESTTDVEVTLYTGRDPEPGAVACIELAVYKEVLVQLASPLGGRRIVDGAA